MSLIEVRNLGKNYQKFSSEWKRVLTWFGFKLKAQDTPWVLRGISFTIEPGESVGIVGQNGAGKSTLLKMITGTQQPAEGTVIVNGRISAILELGMGFRPEFTGRENSYNGLEIMGYSRAEIDQIMPDLEKFAEIGEYFDQLLRTYSSGMQMRVAFAIATAFRPDLLIIDEALSVGDSYFQHKSIARIHEFQEQGTSLLFVSHDRGAIQAVCSRALLFDKGRLLKDGSPEEISDYYNAMIAEKEGVSSTITQETLDNGRVQTISGSRKASIINVVVMDCRHKEVEIIEVGDEVILQVDVKVNEELGELVMGYMIKDRLAREVYGTNTYHSSQQVKSPRPGEVIRYEVQFIANIGVGNYAISIALHDSENHLSSNYEWRELAAVFTVENYSKMHFLGGAWIEPYISVEKLQ